MFYGTGTAGEGVVVEREGEESVERERDGESEEESKDRRGSEPAGKCDRESNSWSGEPE